MAQSVRRLLHEHEDPSSIPGTYTEAGEGDCVCKTGPGDKTVTG